jgi:hypothetical protein
VGGRRRADGATRPEAVGRARLDATETGLHMGGRRKVTGHMLTLIHDPNT